MKNKKTILSVAAVILAVLILLGAWLAFGPKTAAGGKSITISVVYPDGRREDYPLSTDAEYLKDAADEVLELEGEVGAYGFTLYTVNGVTADFTRDSAYWAIYVNGEYGQYGVDTQPVTDGGEYSFIYEKY